MQKKKNQHYIWKHYLRAWSVNDRTHCLRDGKIFNSNLDNIGCKRYFYKLEKLDSEDVEFIEKLLFEDIHPAYKELNKELIPLHKSFFDLKDQFQAHGLWNDEIDERFDIAITNALEDFHGGLEKFAIPILTSMQKEDMSFLDDDNILQKFLYYFTMQYFRTNKRKEAIARTKTASFYPQTIKTWNICAPILASRMAFSLFLDKEQLRFIFLKSKTPLITGDQPIINTFVDYTTNKMLSETEAEFYYPLTPNLALLVSYSNEYNTRDIVEISDIKAIHYNSQIFYASHDQIYSDSDETLKDFLKIPERTF